eukprot:TRINITY_DN2957_c0_g1_i1.p1 TRINITY_DN2957_c0_g1~~TRINITY_DN2957_c0_g1_i1.p1  ORF type:complete len:228 (-),score=75.14 TRINITY_DN2957_c0_g1_i1:227-841(-)
MAFNEFDHLFKVLLLGDSNVGKSCFLLRFTDDTFLDSFTTTIGVDFKLKTFEVDGKSVKLQIWDTAGQERFRTITSSYYRGAHGIIIVYDLTNQQTFSNVHHWIKEVDRYAVSNVPKIIVGNKSDCDTLRAVDQNTGRDFANSMGNIFLEASAKTGYNIEETFTVLVREMVRRQDPSHQSSDMDGLSLVEDDVLKKQGSCFCSK